MLGVMIPTLFSVVALMAKKALISSLVALALSFYAVTHSSKKYYVKIILLAYDIRMIEHFFHGSFPKHYTYCALKKGGDTYVKLML